MPHLHKAGDASQYTGDWPGGNGDFPHRPDRTPPMSQRTVIRVMVLGFSLVVLLVLSAAWLGYRGSLEIQENAQQMVREHLVPEPKAIELENRIEKRSEAMLNELIWILGACFLLATGCSGATLYFTRRNLSRLEWQQQELLRVSWQMLQDQERVSRRFAHEMHDELGQALTGLKGLAKRLTPEEFGMRRQEFVNILDGVLRDVRDLSQLLRPVILDDFGLSAALRWLAEGFSERTRIAVDFQSNTDLRMSDELETHMFRIAQEALTNIARHSKATQASIALSAQGETIQLTIRDNGCGIDPSTLSATFSLGMVGMRARARQIGGQLDIRNQPEGGLLIQLSAPVTKADTNAEQENPSLVG